MLRRHFIRAVFSIGIAPKFLFSQQTAGSSTPPPAPVPWTLGLNAKTPLPHTEAIDGIAETELRFFTPQQMASLRRLCDVLLPPIGNKPGALQAETPLFLDFLIGNSPETRRSMYTGGLDWLETQTQKSLKMPFAKLSDAQADTLLKPWLRTWMSDHPPSEVHADFVNIAHDDIRTATVNSKAWSNVPSVGAQASATTGLYWSPIEPEMYGESEIRTRIQASVMAAPKASHPTSAYPQ